MNYFLGGFFTASNEENRSMTEEAIINYLSVTQYGKHCTKYIEQKK
jgi:hypothetical protein